LRQGDALLAAAQIMRLRGVQRQARDGCSIDASAGDPLWVRLSGE
jgi:hypothetical protein